MDDYLAGVETGIPEAPLLPIVGRPGPGRAERFVIWEEPGEPVQMHYRGKQVPHFKHDCPHCLPTDSPKPLWYVGVRLHNGHAAIAELTYPCLTTIAAAARRIPLKGPQRLDVIIVQDVSQAAVFTGLLVKIQRPDSARSPRYARCEQRTEAPLNDPWTYNTRRELARIWNIPLKPRLYKEA
jgi:hypothetical protein